MAEEHHQPISTGVCPQHLMVTVTLCKPNVYHWTTMFMIFTGGTAQDFKSVHMVDYNKKGRKNGLNIQQYKIVVSCMVEHVFM